MPPVKSEQTRNLRIIGTAGTVLFLLLLLSGMALYLGWELPPLDLRGEHATPDGYATPPRAVTAPPGTVTRASLSAANAIIPSADPNRNPLAADPEAISLGQQVYHVNCEMCHGKPGEAIGAVGERYNPHPPPLIERVPGASDARLYASVTDGIRSTPSAETARYLPQEWHAYQAMLSDRERWAVVAYLRSAYRSQ